MSTFFGEELAGGEFDCVAEAVREVGGAGKLDGGVVVTNSKGDFLDHEVSVWTDDSGADDVIGFIG